MKTTQNFLLLLLMGLTVISCDIQKRHYRSGFYVGGNAVKSVPGKERENKVLTQIREEEMTDFSRNNVASTTATEKSEVKPVSAPKTVPDRKIGKINSQKTVVSNNNSLKKKKTLGGSNEKIVQEIDFQKEKEIKNYSVITFICGLLPYLLAVFSVVLSSVFYGSAVGYLFLLGIVFAILALVFGSIARNKKREYGLPVQGYGLAIAGKTLAICYLAILIAIGVLIVALFSALSGSSGGCI